MSVTSSLSYCTYSLMAIMLFFQSTDLNGRFNLFLFPPSALTPTATVSDVVSQLLQTLQKASSVAQSRASEILPLLLKFLGYNSENPGR